MKKYNVIFLIFFFVTPLLADVSLMSRPWGERAYALGQVGGVLIHDSSDVYWNSAGLNFLKMGDIGIGHRFWFDGYQDEYLSLGFKVNPYFSFGVGGYVNRNGKIEMFDTENNPLGLKNFYEYLGILGLGFSENLIKIRNLNIGLSVKYNGTSFNGEIWKRHIGVDVGVLYHLKLQAYIIELSGLFQNLYEYEKWYDSSLSIENSFKIDKSIVLSAGVRLNAKSSFFIKYHSKVHTIDDIGIGYDYKAFDKQIHLSKKNKAVPLVIDVRAGAFSSDMIFEYEKLSLGAGIRFSYFQLNYTYKPNPISTLHLLSLNVNIPPIKHQKKHQKKGKQKKTVIKNDKSKKSISQENIKTIKTSEMMTNSSKTNKVKVEQEEYVPPIDLGVEGK